MIELSCTYCGGPVGTEETGVYKQVQCPTCGHAIPVRPRRPADPPESVRGNGLVGHRDWVGKSNKQIATELLAGRVSQEEQDRQVAKVVLPPLLPRYDDLTLFALSLSFALLAMIDVRRRQDLGALFSMGLGP